MQSKQLIGQFRVKERRLRIWRVDVGGKLVRGDLTQKCGQSLRTGVSLTRIERDVGGWERTYERDDECHNRADVQEDGRCRHT